MLRSGSLLWIQLMMLSIFPDVRILYEPFAIIYAAIQIPTPAPETAGLVWGDGRFWASHQGTGHDAGQVIIVNRVDKVWHEWTRFPGVAGPIAWDESHNSLRVVDWSSGVIAEYGVTDVPPTRKSTTLIPQQAMRTTNTISGLTWDGTYLWLVTDCGLCSTVFKIDPGTGEVLSSFFPKCVPRGLGYRPGNDPARGELWMAAYRGPNRGAFLSRRQIAGSPPTPGTTPRYFSFGGTAPPPRSPGALTIVGDRVWVVDQATNGIRSYELTTIP